MTHRDDSFLFDYQVEMKDRLYASRREVRSVMVQMPTGTGKTHLLVSVVRDYVRSESRPVWIVVHRIELVEQISSTLVRYGISHVRYACGSFSSIPSPVAGEEARGRLAPSVPGMVCVVSIQTLSSLWNRCGVAGDVPPTPGLLVIDEAHHSPARSYSRLWKLFPGAYKLGMTATPCRLGGGGFTSLFDRLLTSRTVSRFIEEGRLSLFDYVSILPGSPAAVRVGRLSGRGADGDYPVKEMGAVLDCEEAVCHLYECYRAFVPGKKGIVYAVNRSHGRHISDCYRSHGVRSACIDSRTPSRERHRLVSLYVCGELDVLVNVDIFSEGFDCPAVEFIQLARPTLSLSKYLQQVGRGLRVHPSKVRTVILDQVGLYLRFGLPTEERDWQSLFRGVRDSSPSSDPGYRERCGRLERWAGVPSLPGGMDEGALPSADGVRDGALSRLRMGVVQLYEDFLRQAANRRAKVEPYAEGGLYGLRKGGEVILPACYPHISPFVEDYALVTYPGRRYGVVTVSGRLLPLPKCDRIVLHKGGLAYVEESPLSRYYLDLNTFERYERLPELFRLDFLEFVYDGFRYHLRQRRRGWKPLPSFSLSDLRIEGDLFFHSGIFIHRSSPCEVYWYEYTDEDGNLIGSDRDENLYFCSPGKAPVYYGVKTWMNKAHKWRFVEPRTKKG